jgi:hypothetical protein
MYGSLAFTVTSLGAMEMPTLTPLMMDTSYTSATAQCSVTNMSVRVVAEM